jgi:hypothetical protein
MPHSHIPVLLQLPRVLPPHVAVINRVRRSFHVAGQVAQIVRLFSSCDWIVNHYLGVPLRKIWLPERRVVRIPLTKVHLSLRRAHKTRMDLVPAVSMEHTRSVRVRVVDVTRDGVEA